MPRIETTRFGDLETVLMCSEVADPKLLVVLCHGYGAPGDDLVPIGHELLSAGVSDVAFAFPAAPLIPDMPPAMDSRAWWPIDVERLMMAVQLGRLDEIRRDFPQDMPPARDKLIEWLRGAQQHYNLESAQTILGGFSQGAMLATETALSVNESVGGLCLYSATLLCEDRWQQMAAATPPMPIVQSHGRMDPVLPFGGAIALRDMLRDRGHNVDFIEFAGMHQIPAEAIDRLVGLTRHLIGE